MGIVKAICVSERRGTPKIDIDEGIFIKDFGIWGDAHGGSWHRQVSLLSYEKVEDFRRRGAHVLDGAFGENLLVEGIDFKELPIGSILTCNDVVLEITQIGKRCHDRCEIYEQVGDCIMPREGVFARTIHGGKIVKGNIIYVI